MNWNKNDKTRGRGLVGEYDERYVDMKEGENFIELLQLFISRSW